MQELIFLVQMLIVHVDLLTPCVNEENLTRIKGDKKRQAAERRMRRNSSRLGYLVRFLVGVPANRGDHIGVYKILAAILFAARKHALVYRADDITPYLIHCLEVAKLLVDIGVRDCNMIASAIVHDTKEDAGAKRLELLSFLDEEHVQVVELVSEDKTRKLFYYEDMKAEPNINVRWKAILLKFPDRRNNLDTLPNLADKERQKRKIEETRRVYKELYLVLKETLTLPGVRQDPDIDFDGLADRAYALITRWMREK